MKAALSTLGIPKGGYTPISNKDIELGEKTNNTNNDNNTSISTKSTSNDSITSDNSSSTNTSNKKESLSDSKQLSFYELMRLLLPYFWPASGTERTVINRIRSTSTWFAVIGSKVCNICSPFYLSIATNELVSGNITPAIHSLILFSLLRLSSTIFKELQSILYIKVKQQAAIELQELTFTHLHNLSLNWHLSKKTG